MRLTVLRGADVLSFAVRRERVVYDVVTTLQFPGEVGYLPYSDDAARMQQYGMLGLLRELSGIEYPRTLNRARAFAIDQRV